MRTGEANTPETREQSRFDRQWESIASKCHPAIFELAQLWKDHPRNDQMEKRLAEIHRKYSGNVQPAANTFAAQIIFREETLKSKDDGLGIFEALHFERHRIPAKIDLKQSEDGNFEASQRILRTLRDLEQLRCSKGPIQPFKVNFEHSGMFEALWGFGIEKLTPEELATFFDQFCQCNSEAHDPDGLKHQQKRFKKSLTR
jgi:hypothetical protein